ncbi:TetR/AcrR family transcriptional regulator [Mycolicibacterium aubagnense]|uniref:HTH-type transcriptional regulator n=1 Tax=Mycolicibacterium aubagnense TaxID=319707 RepID=A0ABM7I813_9MYCO|nr:TetR/AcrR family transcriptional regulator [Mycolicibacterium aubagnense]TLH66894.1 TetR family transcriptional regulator [Mycolicibacterium aubagnense]WGI35257.1 TetR/AcrR family transcriptional regulator [Mycolicibacterium aubagnense]BBX82783.1 putative HTH-type transcriptional regulator [Mycolicibacterium aubagnense]
MVSPRDRMIVSAALLIRERGAHSTAISDVLAHSGAPRGSAYHHFPGGRTELLCEAIDFANEHVARRIAKAGTALEALDVLIDGFRTQLTETEFRAGCPVVAVAVEADNPPVIERAAAAFTRWLAQLEEQLKADGAPAEQATELAMLATTAIEGAVLVARTTGSTAPLDLVHRQLRALVSAAITQRKAST